MPPSLLGQPTWSLSIQYKASFLWNQLDKPVLTTTPKIWSLNSETCSYKNINRQIRTKSGAMFYQTNTFLLISQNHSQSYFMNVHTTYSMCTNPVLHTKPIKHTWILLSWPIKERFFQLAEGTGCKQAIGSGLMADPNPLHIKQLC